MTTEPESSDRFLSWIQSRHCPGLHSLQLIPPARLCARSGGDQILYVFSGTFKRRQSDWMGSPPQLGFHSPVPLKYCFTAVRNLTVYMDYTRPPSPTESMLPHRCIICTNNTHLLQISYHSHESDDAISVSDLPDNSSIQSGSQTPRAGSSQATGALLGPSAKTFNPEAGIQHYTHVLLTSEIRKDESR